MENMQQSVFSFYEKRRLFYYTLLSLYVYKFLTIIP
jgi:hypothetical protein